MLKKHLLNARRVLSVGMCAMVVLGGCRSAPYEHSSIYVPMRDGVRLAVDVYRPPAAAPQAQFPAILHQTRYYRAVDMRGPDALIFPGIYDDRIRRFTAAGYVYIVADIRGSGASFGTRTVPWSREEVQDGVELLAWAGRQEWSNGAFGAVGWSYDGSLAELLASERPSGLRAIAPQYAPFDAYRDAIFPGGVQLTMLSGFWERVTLAMDSNRLGAFLGLPARLVVRGARPVDADKARVLLHEAVRGHTTNERVHSDALRSSFRDDTNHLGRRVDSLAPYRSGAQLTASGVAVLSWSGWYDGALARSAIDRFTGNGGQGNALMLGPWSHTGRKNLSPYSRDTKAFDADGELLRFFDQHLRDDSTRPAAAVRYYTMGREVWRTADRWPPSGSRFCALDITDDRRLVPSSQSAERGTHSLDVQLRDVPMGDATRWDAMLVQNPRRLHIAPRSDVRGLDVRFDAEPLAAPLEITGNPVVVLHGTFSASDGTVFAYLDDVDARGVAHGITEGMLRLIHHEKQTFLRADARPLTANQNATIRIELMPISYEVPAGHHIRLTLTGGDTDHFRQMTPVPLTLHLRREPGAGSRVELPIVGAASSCVALSRDGQ